LISEELIEGLCDEHVAILLRHMPALLSHRHGLVHALGTGHGRLSPPRRVEGETWQRIHAAPSGQASGLDKMVQGRAGDAQNFRDRRFRDRFGQETLNLGFPAVSFDVPSTPLGRPGSRPWARAAAKPSLVRSAIKSRSISAKSPNSVIITLVWMSWVPLS
jgi:hypothetical protein